MYTKLNPHSYRNQTRRRMEVSDIRYEISQHLPLIDSLVLFNHGIFPRKPDIKKIVLQRLKEMGFNNDEAIEFLEQVVKTRSVISGSFMLAVLVSPMDGPLLWQPDDIDVYCFQSNHRKCSAGRASSRQISLFGEFLCSKGMSGEACCAYPIISIMCNRRWEKDGRKINEVIVDRKIRSLRDFIFDTFDFDFCKITYDGKTLSIKDSNSVLTKNCIYRGDKEALKYFSMDFQNCCFPDGSSSGNYDFRMERLFKTYTFRKNKY